MSKVLMTGTDIAALLTLSIKSDTALKAIAVAEEWIEAAEEEISTLRATFPFKTADKHVISSLPYKFWTIETGRVVERCAHAITEHGLRITVERYAGLRHELVCFRDVFSTSAAVVAELEIRKQAWTEYPAKVTV